MSFYDQYELLELIRDDGVRTFHARDKAANQAVTIHLFSNPAAPLQAELLRKIAKLPEAESGRITARGSHLGSVYLVTDSLAPYSGLLEWIAANTKTAKQPDPPPARLDEKPAQNEKPARKTELPLSAVTEPAGQIRLNQEFADLFRTNERPVFPSPPTAAKPVPAAALTRPPFDPNEATQPARVQPGPRAKAGTVPVHRPAPLLPTSMPAGSASPPLVPPALLGGKSKWPLVAIIAGIGVIGILAALFLLFFARRAHYL